MLIKDIEHLLHKYRLGTCSQEEKEQVENWYNQLQNTYNWELPQEQAQEVHDRMLAHIQSHIKDTQDSNTRTGRTVIRKLLYWSAAAVLLCTFWGIHKYKWLQKPVRSVSVAIADKPTDIKPGQTGAILTLGNGQKIVLDSVGNGLLAQQAGVHILHQNGQIVYTGRAQETLYNTVSTPAGRIFRLLLPDGTLVWLNASSSITFPTTFRDKDRQVSFTGEAYFEVAHHSAQRFRITVGNQIVEDIGTQFNINAYNDEPAIATTLLEGAVNVSTLNSPAAQSVHLHPGEQAVLQSTGKIKVNSDIDINEIMAWKEGIFQFNRADIKTIMRQAARWYNIEVQYEGEINATFSGGISRNVNASQLFHILESTDKVIFEISGNKVFVKPKK